MRGETFTGYSLRTEMALYDTEVYYISCLRRLPKTLLFLFRNVQCYCIGGVSHNLSSS